MGKKQVFVIAANGTVGQVVVKALSSEFGEQIDVKAGVKNPQTASALNDLKAVTVVKAEMGDRAALKEIFRGVDSLFIANPDVENQAHLVTETARAAQEAGVKFLLVYSVPLADVPDTIFGKHFGESESTVASLGVPCAFLRLPMLMEVFLVFATTIEKESRMYVPVRNDTVIPVIASQDMGLAAATILVAPPEKHAGNTYTLVGDRASHEDAATALSKQLGREIQNVQISFEESREVFKQLGLPKWRADGVQELLQLMEAGHPAANMVNVDLNALSEITGRKPTDLVTWFAKMRDLFK